MCAGGNPRQSSMKAARGCGCVCGVCVCVCVWCVVCKHLVTVNSLQMYRTGGRQIIHTENQANTSGIHHIGIHVADVHQACRKVGKHGADIYQSYRQVPGCRKGGLILCMN